MEATTPSSQIPEIWQVDAGGQIYETNFEEMTQWIAEGSLLPQDKVRRGNLRWIEAQKVPTLIQFFNAKETGTTPPVITTNTNSKKSIQNFANHNKANSLETSSANQLEYLKSNELEQNHKCLLHEFNQAKFVCETCINYFCRECPKSYGENVKFCPMCGAMVKPIFEAKKKAEKIETYQFATQEKFGFKDFGRAIVYPFKFPISLFFGAILFMICSIASDAAAIGGRWLLVAAIISGMAGNTLVFGILSNIIENMLQGKINQNFMPSFDDFTIWDDVIQPFLLSIGVYLSSFGALILLLVVLFFFVTNPTYSGDQKAVSTFAPELQQNYGAAKNGKDQIDFIREAVNQQGQMREKQIAQVQDKQAQIDRYVISVEDGQVIEQSQITPAPAPVYDEEKEFEKLNEMVTQTQKQQLESSIGQMPESDESNFAALTKNVKNWSKTFLILAVIFFVWGIFYLPVAFIVAAYTRNLNSVFNPLIGLDTIKRLGFDYIKILFFSFILLLCNGFLNTALNVIFAPFNLPKLGNIPVIAVGSIFTFYFLIVFSLILGFALFKNSDKFQMYKNINTI